MLIFVLKVMSISRNNMCIVAVKPFIIYVHETRNSNINI